MKLSKIEVNNFRLLNNFILTPEDNLSLIIGKNNTAKTSLLTVLDKFINYQKSKSFTFNDLNIETQGTLKNYFLSNIPTKEEYKNILIILKLYISYTETDDISNLSKWFVDLTKDNNTVVLSYEYILDYENIAKMYADFLDFACKPQKNDHDTISKEISICKFFNMGIKDYFNLIIKTIQYDEIEQKLNNDVFFTISSVADLRDTIAFDFVGAKRDVSNKNNNSVLSQQVVNIFNTNEDNCTMKETYMDLRRALIRSDYEIGNAYSVIFGAIKEVIKKFGGMVPDASQIEVMSDLKAEELLKNNATVVYQHGGQNLPEHYNGLGYMNLFSILFELESVFARIIRGKNEKPADINLIFIEEPEAHTHPQMQYIFIKNIKELMREKLKRADSVKVNYQCFLSTHSSHIISSCDFDDIKYLKKREDGTSVEAKNIQELQKLYEKDGDSGKDAYRFLKQYLTINRSELFFTEKAIFVEGDSERILLPAMMKKIDKKHPQNALLSQNISIVDGAGSHSKIFSKFIQFIGLKSLIITDIDTYYDIPHANNKQEHCSCPSSDPRAVYTWNSSLRFFHCRKDDKTCQYFLNPMPMHKTVGYDPNTETWEARADGCIFTAYQFSKNGDYGGCSFEDAFIEENKAFILEHGKKFDSLKPKWFTEFQSTTNSFDLAQNGIKKKSAFALDVLLHEPEIAATDTTPNNTWVVPLYIREGLEWLRDL